MKEHQTDNGTLFYLDQGSGSTVLVFGHGTLISSNIWRDLFFPHLPESWRVLAPDFRGHGASRQVTKGCNFMTMAGDIAELASDLKIGRFIYVGLSMGGGVGLQLALTRPELLRGLVLISPVTGLGSLGNPIFQRLGKFMAGNRRLLRMGMKMAASRSVDPHALENVVDEAMLVSREVLSEYLSPQNRIQGAEHYMSLNVPTLMMVGLKDKVIPAKQQLRLARILPNCNCITFPQHGHALCAEEPKQVIDSVKEFIQELPD